MEKVVNKLNPNGKYFIIESADWHLFKLTR